MADLRPSQIRGSTIRLGPTQTLDGYLRDLVIDPPDVATITRTLQDPAYAFTNFSRFQHADAFRYGMLAIDRLLRNRIQMQIRALQQGVMLAALQPDVHVEHLHGWCLIWATLLAPAPGAGQLAEMGVRHFPKSVICMMVELHLRLKWYNSVADDELD